MAVAWTGDVLAGALGALLANVSNPLEAACVATYLHGLAGELGASGNGSAHALRLGHDRGLLASELAAHLPAALAACPAGSRF